MIIDIGENTIETDDIENVTPIYQDWYNDELVDTFKVYLRISFVIVRSGKNDRDRLINAWKGENRKWPDFVMYKNEKWSVVLGHNGEPFGEFVLKNVKNKRTVHLTMDQWTLECKSVW